jgi:poly-gamma-glutamate synthesis protein (capsule biosynthesis protein)
MYFLTLETDGRMLQRLSMTPTRTQRLRINRAPPEAASWLAHIMDRECRRLGARVELKSDGALELSWSKTETGVTS